jgi:hypothetical protein
MTRMGIAAAVGLIGLLCGPGTTAARHAADAATPPVPVLDAQGGSRPAQASSLSKVRSLNTRQVADLQRAGVPSVTELASLRLAQAATLLGADETTAALVIEEARAVKSRLDATYARAQSLYRVAPQAGGDSYANLIAPENKCTMLVRKTCGVGNQCPSTNGCTIAMELLQRFNAGREADLMLDACWAALEDEIVFPACPAARGASGPDDGQRHPFVGDHVDAREPW